MFIFPTSINFDIFWRKCNEALHLSRSYERESSHVIVDSSVTVIRKSTFFWCEHLVSIILGDNVKRIEGKAFHCCVLLRFLRLSKTLEYIGLTAFFCCESVEALFLPSSVRVIKDWAFDSCRSLRLLILPHDIDLNNVGDNTGRVIIDVTAIQQIAENAGVKYKDVYPGSYHAVEDSNRRVNEWLIHQVSNW